MNTPSTPFHDIAGALADEGWCVVADFLSAAQTQALADDCRALRDAQRLTPARVGSLRTATPLRSDSTYWFQADALSAPQQVFVDRLDALRVTLNRELMLGLAECESHYAVYPPGSGYTRHLDRLRDSDARVLSAVFYLNEAWQVADGGALRLYLANGSLHDIFPHAGTLLLFLSAQFEHEVLPATRERMSIACWMRQRALVPTF